MPIPEMMAFPIDLMQSVGDQIVTDAQTLENDVAAPIGQIKQAVGALPASMQASLHDFVTALDRGTAQMVAARVTVGKRLNAAAAGGASADTAGATAFGHLLT